jgi:FtsH-binding integral membrane protein
MQNLAATVFTLGAAAVSFGLGLVYLFRPQFMRYHSVAVEEDWKHLDTHLQTLVLALMRVASGGMLSASLTIAMLQVHFNREPQRWVAFVILICGAILITASLYGMYLVRTRTKGRPPIAAAVAALVALAVGFYFNLRYLNML